MSLLRQRATAVRVLSTLRALRPAAARLRFVSAMRSFSEVELKVPLSQARTDRGWARLTTEVRVNTRATRAAIRRGTRPEGEESEVVSRLRGVMRSVGSHSAGPLGGGGRSGVVLTVGRWCGRVPGAKVPRRRPRGYRSLPDRPDGSGAVRRGRTGTASTVQPAHPRNAGRRYPCRANVPSWAWS